MLTRTLLPVSTLALLLPSCVATAPSDLSDSDARLVGDVLLAPREEQTLAIGASVHLTATLYGDPVRRMTWSWDPAVVDLAGLDCEPRGLCFVEGVEARPYGTVATVVLQGARSVRARVEGVQPGRTLVRVDGFARGPCAGVNGPFECGPSSWAFVSVRVVP